MELRVHLGIQTLRAAVQGAGLDNDPWMRDLWARITINAEIQQLGLLAPTVAELRLCDVDWQHAVGHVIGNGIGQLCPAEVGPLLALQQGGEELIVLMETLRGLNDCRYTLSVRRGQLVAYQPVPGRVLSPSSRLVFIPTTRTDEPASDTFGIGSGCI